MARGAEGDEMCPVPTIRVSQAVLSMSTPRTLAADYPSLVEVTHVADWARLTYSMHKSRDGTR